MAGHNKWSKVKHKKAAQDEKKSKIFSLHARLLEIESRKAEGDTNSPGLKAAIDRARAVNMPNDNISRAIQKGAGGSGEALEEVVYEAYGPGGTALIIKGVTDNKNRTSAEIKHTLGILGGTLASPGSVLWAFEKNGTSFVPRNTVPLSEENILALRNLVRKLEDRDDVGEIITNEEAGV